MNYIYSEIYFWYVNNESRKEYETMDWMNLMNNNFKSPKRFSWHSAVQATEIMEDRKKNRERTTPAEIQFQVVSTSFEIQHPFLFDATMFTA